MVNLVNLFMYWSRKTIRSVMQVVSVPLQASHQYYCNSSRCFLLAYIVFYFTLFRRWYLCRCSNLFLNCAFSLWIIKLTSALTYDLESANLRLIEVHFWRLLTEFFVPRYEYLREATTKVRTVQVRCRLDATRLPICATLVLLYHVHFIALRTKHLDTTASEFITEADWQALLAAAKCTWTMTKDTLQIFIDYFCQT